jgi:excinuclease ABC subunit C
VLERPNQIPDAPGSYQFKDADGRIIYVGKANSLRQRLSNYFGDTSQLHPRTQQMLERATSVEWIQVQSDVEAIMLEYNLIKTHRPRFNIRLVDDKSYPYLAVTLGEKWPRAMVVRGAKRRENRYFGPYAHAYAIRDTLDSMLRTFPIRSCTNTKFNRHERLGRPCLLFHIERCSGPCVGEVDAETYAGYLQGLMDVLDGDIDTVVAGLEAEMASAADELEFERAALVRDRLEAVRLASERQEMVADKNEDMDVISLVDDELEAAAQILHIRRGRVVGRQGLILEKVEPMDEAELVGRVLTVHYAESPLGVPKEVLVPALPEDPEAYTELLSERRGARVAIRIPQRGRRRRLLETARTNATEQLQRHRMRRSGDLTTRAQALEELQGYLGLSEAPLRIECYDMSHLQGSDYVGSMVVMEDGLPKRSDYRRFKVTGVAGNDDYGAMAEVLERRLRHLVDIPGVAVPTDAAPAPVAEPDAPDSTEASPAPVAAIGEERRPRRFAYPPQLILLDGGKGQLSVGIRILEELGLTDRIALASLAKQFEEVFVPGKSEPIRIPRDSRAIYLLQQIRDEAHRFAITYHRELRQKRQKRSALDEVPGLGEARRRRLISELGGVRAVQRASLEDLLDLSWLPDEVARTLYRHLHDRAPELRQIPGIPA